VGIDPALQLRIENIEIDLLLEALYQRYGYDFRAYARASIERRIRQFMHDRKEACVADLIPKLLYDEAYFSDMVQCFSVTVTEMFRDPAVYLALRQEVVPLLRTYPFVKVWHAGCATGEEVYSLAILLTEEGIYDRTTIFATDFNDHSLAHARQGIFPAGRMKEFSQQYRAAGGHGSLADYYHARYDSVAMDAKLRSRITFANHNLTADAAFGEMHLIVCRNVLIYFNRALQDRALTLFDASLLRGGFLCLGTKETLEFSSVADRFEALNKPARLFRKRFA
jgi:chemotaxis protein methyltransferase CheR